MLPTTGMAASAPPAMGWVEGMGGTKVRGLGLAAGVARLGVQLVAGASGGSGGLGHWTAETARVGPKGPASGLTFP